jgi:hypothetical protein
MFTNCQQLFHVCSYVVPVPLNGKFAAKGTTGWSRHLCLRLGLDKHPASAPEASHPCHAHQRIPTMHSAPSSAAPTTLRADPPRGSPAGLPSRVVSARKKETPGAAPGVRSFWAHWWKSGSFRAASRSPSPPVFLTDYERATRASGSGRIPRMCPSPCRIKVFFPTRLPL